MRILARIAFLLATVFPLAAVAEDGERYALFIGINDYDTSTHLTPLKYAEPDVTEMARAFLDLGFKPENIRLMVQGEIADPRLRPAQPSANAFKPVKTSIMKQLDLILAAKQAGDTVVVAVAGHGLQFTGKQEVYFCPSDGDAADASTLIDVNEFYTKLSNCNAGAKLLISDCCRNDPLLSFVRGKNPGEVPQSLTRVPKIEPASSLAALYSCGAGQFAHEDEGFKGGVFTHFLVERLRGKGSENGEVDLSSLVTGVQRDVQNYVRNTFSALQVPEVKLALGNSMVLGKLSKSSKPPATAPGNSQFLIQTVTNYTTTYALLNNVTSTTTDVSSKYSWKKDGAEKVLSLQGTAVKQYTGNTLTSSYIFEPGVKMVGSENGLPEKVFTEATLKDEFKARLQDCINKPLFKLKLDANGKVVSQSLLISNEVRKAMDGMNWSVIDSASALELPYFADRDEWKTEHLYGLGYGIYAKGTVTLTKIPGGKNGQAVKISAKYTCERFQSPVYPALLQDNTAFEIQGSQEYDSATKEWISGSFAALGTMNFYQNGNRASTVAVKSAMTYTRISK